MSEEKRNENFDLNLEDIMIVFVGSDEKVVDINQKGIDFLGYSKSEVVGKNWFDQFIPQKIREEMRLSFHQMLNGTFRRGHSKKPILTKNGQERIIDWHNLPLKDERSNFVGAVFSGQDINYRKRIEINRDKQTLI